MLPDKIPNQAMFVAQDSLARKILLFLRGRKLPGDPSHCFTTHPFKSLRMARKTEKINGPRMFCDDIDESLPPFVVNLWNLVNHHNLWTSGGRAFHIPNEAQFESTLLPKYYKHCKLASFVRQLNMYVMPSDDVNDRA
jgi:hypothetical protein